MKKFYLFGLMVSVSVSLASCTKDIVISQSGVTATIDAKISTKVTTSNGFNYSWSKGDKIGLFQAKKGTDGKYTYPEKKPTSFETTKGDGSFTGTLTTEALAFGCNSYSVVFPRGLVNDSQQYGGTGYVGFQTKTSALTTQTGSLSDLGNNMIFAGKDIEYSVGSDKVSFRGELSTCFTSVIKLNVPESLGIKKIDVTADHYFYKSEDSTHGRYYNICGKNLFAFDGRNMADSDVANKTLSVIRNSGADTISGDVYIAILCSGRVAGATFSRVDKFKLVFYKEDLTLPAATLVKDLGIAKKVKENPELTTDNACQLYGLVGGTINNFGSIPETLFD